MDTVTKHRAAFLSVIGLAGALVSSSVAASGTLSPLRQDVPAPIWVGERIAWNATRWSQDSRTLFFTGIDNGTHYLEFQVGDNTLRELVQPPLTINLSPQQQAQFQAASQRAFVAWDHSYIIYESKHLVPCCEGGEEHALALGNVNTGDYALIEKGTAVSYSVIWSANSAAALIVDVGHYGGVGGIWHVSGFQESVANLHASLLMNYTAGSHGYVDISPDGQRVLIPEHWYDMETGLRLWDGAIEAPPQQFAAASNPILLADQVVHGAAFVPAHDDELLVVMSAGIVRFNTTTADIQLINPAINAAWVDWAYFSPDRRYVAILTHPERSDRSAWPCQMFVLSVDVAGDIQSARNDHPCAFYG
ncbi:MAG: hypothetical protein RBT75_18760 [Anaerolineae bacterium]|nr:hypothetical protein [Anaerolineae bacterium]